MENKLYEKTWDKLESVLNNEEFSYYSESKVIKPFRKLSASSSRPVTRKHEIRSVSVSHESPNRQRRPNSAFTHSLPYSSTVSGLSPSQVQSIYIAKCSDLGIPPLPDQERRFFNFCAVNFKDRKFCLKDSGLGIKTAHKIGEILRHNSFFSYVDLSKNTFKDQGAVSLIKYLKNSTSLVHLDISSNEITTEGSEAVISELFGHESLASFDISSHEGFHRNRLGTQGAGSITKLLQSSSILAFLNLAGTGLGPEGLEILLRGVRKNYALTSLNLSNNMIGPRPIEKLAEAVIETDLKELNLSKNKIGNEGCEYISLMISGDYNGPCSVMKLDLSENEISMNGVSKIFAGLRINSQILQLNLMKNFLAKGLSQNFLQCLVENCTLETFNLSYCELKCESLVGIAEGLSKNNGIKHLQLGHNLIQDRGAEMIAFGLSKNRVLKFVDLSSNKIRDKGGISIAKSLMSNDSIETLHLKDNFLNDESGQLFAEVTRIKHNLLKLTLDLNQLNYKYIDDVKRNVTSNFEHQKKILVPKLQKIIERIHFDGTILAQIHGKIALKEKEKNDGEKKLINQGNKLERTKEIEAAKLKEIQDEYNRVREESLRLSSIIDEIGNEANVICI